MTIVTYAVIGCGQRITSLVELLNNKESVRLKGGWDPSEANVQQMLDLSNKGEGLIYSGYEEIVSDPEVDWVLIGSPNAFHNEHISAAFRNNKHVFTEKPLAIDIDDCIGINRIHEQSGKLFATGFTLRYARIYRKAKEILSSGRLGKIVSINASENIPPEHGAYIMKNWRRKKELSGPHILEKCVHDLDVLNWFTDSVPLRIAAFGGNNMFIPENNELYVKESKVFDAWNHVSVSSRYEEDEANPFLSEKSIEDNLVAIMEYANEIRVQFQATMSNTIPERRMYIHCTGGTLILELYSGIIRYKALGDETVHELSLPGGGHGDGDIHITNELHDSMVKRTVPACGGEEGLLSAVVGITIDKARREKRIIDLRETWNSLNVEFSPF